jgi:L-amino acid N-acyltransferase YncA
LQAGIFPKSPVSLKIHENSGFRRVGYREKIGQRHGEWRDCFAGTKKQKSSYTITSGLRIHFFSLFWKKGK